MKHLLRKGQVFRCGKFRDLVGSLTVEQYDHHIDWNKLHFDHSKTCTITGKETAPGGWTRPYTETVDLTVPDAEEIGSKDFVVVEVDITGGGISHNRSDVYPDGHHIVAREAGTDRQVEFYQTGCFVGMVEPADIELISGPEDKAVKYRKTFEEVE